MKQAEKEREKQSILMSKTMGTWIISFLKSVSLRNIIIDLSVVEEPEVEENPWRGLQPIDNLEDRVIYGENSQEREIQAARESSTLQALYFKGQL